MKRGFLVMLMGCFLLPGMLGCTKTESTKEEISSSFDTDIPENFRAVWIPGVPLAQAGLLQQGDYVDVLYTFHVHLRDNVTHKVTATLLQNILVLRVLPAKDEKEAGAVVLAMTPKDAQYIALALANGEVMISQRGKNDHTMYTFEIADFERLFEDEDDTTTIKFIEDTGYTCYEKDENANFEKVTKSEKDAKNVDLGY